MTASYQRRTHLLPTHKAKTKSRRRRIAWARRTARRTGIPALTIYTGEESL